MARPKAGIRRVTVAERLDRFGLGAICDRLIDGQALRGIARDVGVSPASMLRWIDEDQDRRRQYVLARMAQAEAIASEIISIADEPVPLDADGRMDAAFIAHQRVRIDARKWVASKLKPQVYGDKLDLSGDAKVELTPEQCHARAAVLLAKLGIRWESADGTHVVTRVGESDANKS